MADYHITAGKALEIGYQVDMPFLDLDFNLELQNFANTVLDEVLGKEWIVDDRVRNLCLKCFNLGQLHCGAVPIVAELIVDKAIKEANQ